MRIRYIDLNVTNNNFSISSNDLLQIPSEIDHFITLNGINILKFDNNSNRLFWVCGGRSETNETGGYHTRDIYFGIYNISPSGQNPSANKIYSIFRPNDGTKATYLKSISDVVFTTDIDSSFYIARKRHIERYEINNNIVSAPDSIPAVPGRFGKLLFVEQIGKVLAFPYRLHFQDHSVWFETSMDTIVDVYMIDCVSHNVKTFTAPSRRISDAIFLPAYNDLIMCYAPDRFRQTTDSSDFAVYKFINDDFAIIDTMLTTSYRGNEDANTLNRPYKLLRTDANNEVLVTWTNEITKMTRNAGNDHYSKSAISGNYRGHFFYGGINNDTNTYIISLAKNGIVKTGGTNISETIRTGFIAHHSVAIPGQNKIVFFNRLQQDSSVFYIHDTENNTTVCSEPIPGAIGDIIHNPYYNGQHLLVSENSENGKVWIYSADNGQKLSFLPIPYSDVTHEYFKKMFINPEGELLISADMYAQNKTETSPYILIGRADSYNTDWSEFSITMPTNQSYVYFYNTDFCFNSLNNRTYITICPGTYEHDVMPYGNVPSISNPYQAEKTYFLEDMDALDNGYLLEYYINEDEEQQFNTLSSLKFPNQVLFPETYNYSQSESSGKLIINADSLYVYDLTSGSKTGIIEGIFNICYSKVYNKVFSIKDTATLQFGEIRKIALQAIDLNSSSFPTSTVYFNGQASGFFINPHNQNLYLHIKMGIDKDGEIPIQLVEINPSDLTTIATNNLPNRSFFPEYDYTPDLVMHHFFYNLVTPYFDSLNSIIYIPSGGHSNISKIEFEPQEALFLGDDINWISFPRLVSRTSTGAYLTQPLLNSDCITPGDYSYGLMSHFDKILEDTRKIRYEPQGSSWIFQLGDNELDSVYSDLGYKLILDDPIQHYFLLSGDLPSSTEKVELIEDMDSWVGYWINETQHPLNAIPESVQDDIYYIKAKHWQCQRSSVPDGSTPPAQNPLSCLAAKGRVELKYGDMVVIHSVSNSDFEWQSDSGGSSEEERMATENFNFTEQADYTAVIVELDSTNNPQEIGAFVGDSCVGATKVWESDSTILVQTYMEGMTGELTILEYPANKSGTPIKYLLLNKERNKWENNPIYAQDNIGSYFISLNENKNINTPGEESDNLFMCYPNPAKSRCFVEYVLDCSTQVEITVFDILGNNVESIVNCWQEKGHHVKEWDLSKTSQHKLTPGIYIVKIRTDFASKETKLILSE